MNLYELIINSKDICLPYKYLPWPWSRCCIQDALHFMSVSQSRTAAKSGILVGHWTIKLGRQLCEYENQTLEAYVVASSLYGQV